MNPDAGVIGSECVELSIKIDRIQEECVIQLFASDGPN